MHKSSRLFLLLTQTPEQAQVCNVWLSQNPMTHQDLPHSVFGNHSSFSNLVQWQPIKPVTVHSQREPVICLQLPIALLTPIITRYFAWFIISQQVVAAIWMTKLHDLVIGKTVRVNSVLCRPKKTCLSFMSQLERLKKADVCFQCCQSYTLTQINFNAVNFFNM